MTDKGIVFVTCETAEEAGRIAETIVTEKLAACVNVAPGIRSCYIWEERLNWSNEVLLVIKTTLAAFGPLEKRILELHSYTTPEIVYVPIAAGNENYLRWIDASVVRR